MASDTVTRTTETTTVTGSDSNSPCGPGVCTTRTTSPGNKGSAGNMPATTPTPTTDDPSVGTTPASNPSGVNNPPAGKSNTAREPATASKWSAGTVCNAGSNPTRTTIKSSGAITSPRCTTDRAANTSTDVPAAVHNHNPNKAPNTTNATEPTNNNGRRRNLGGTPNTGSTIGAEAAAGSGGTVETELVLVVTDMTVLALKRG